MKVLSTVFNIKNTMGPGMVVHTCNPSYAGNRGRRIMIQGWSRVKSTRHVKIAKAKRTEV
jgi:hypothetical protein